MDASHASELQYFLEVRFPSSPPSGAAVRIHNKQRKPQAPAGLPRKIPGYLTQYLSQTVVLLFGTA